MALYKFRDVIYLNYKNTGFLWEPSWRSFRPIDSISWNGTTFSIDDRTYCKDPSDSLYGYGSEQMKQVCSLLTQKFEPAIAGATEVKTPAIGKLEWFQDRFVSLTACAPRDTSSWKRLIKGKHNTLRKAPRNKPTRRVL
jgi:hypothetical protein